MTDTNNLVQAVNDVPSSDLHGKLMALFELVKAHLPNVNIGSAVEKLKEIEDKVLAFEHKINDYEVKLNALMDSVNKLVDSSKKSK